MADTDGWQGGRSPSPRPGGEEERPRASASPVQGRQSEGRERDDGDARGRSTAPRSGGGPDAEQNPGNNLHVSGLAARVTDRDLDEVFAKYGKIVKAQVMYDPHSREPRGFGFVTFESGDEAEAAMTALDGFELMGRSLKVQKAKRGRARTPTPGQYYGPPKRGEGGGGGGGGYRGGPPRGGGGYYGGGGGGYGGGYGGGADYRYGPPPTSMRGGDPWGRSGPPRGGGRDDYPVRPPRGGDRYGGSRRSPPPRGDGYDRYGGGGGGGGAPPPRDFPVRPPRDGAGAPPPAGSRYGDLPPPRSRYDDVPPRRH